MTGAPRYTYPALHGLNGVTESAYQVAKLSGTISAIAASTGIGGPVAIISGVVAGLASLVGRIGATGSATKTAINQTEAANAQLRLQILEVDAANSKLSNLITTTNADIKNLNGLGALCLFNCGAKKELKTVQQQYADLQAQLEGKLKLSEELAQKALETVQKLTGLKTEKNILLWGGGIALGLSVTYLLYKSFQS